MLYAAVRGVILLHGSSQNSLWAVANGLQTLKHKSVAGIQHSLPSLQLMALQAIEEAETSCKLDTVGFHATIVHTC